LNVSFKIFDEVRIIQRGGVRGFTVSIDERMYPQDDAEIFVFQSLQESANVGKPDGIKLSGAVAGLSVIYLDLAVVEIIGDDLIRVGFHHFLGDIDLVSGPSGP